MFLQWLGSLSAEVLGGIIATVVCGLFVSTVFINRKRKSKLKIHSSEIGGDVVAGDKLKRAKKHTHAIKDNNISSTTITKTKVHGDVVQGDKEG